MTTIKDIAKACGVSAATVSKALNGYDEISQETVGKIRRTAEKMQYQPNSAARLLRTNSSHNIGIVFEDETRCGLVHDYYANVLNSVRSVMEENGYDVTFISSRIAGHSYLDHCRWRQVDGVLVDSTDGNEEQVKDLVHSEIPAVTIDCSIAGHSSVLSDDEEGTYELVKYLIEMGHTKIGFVHGEMVSITKERLKGYNRALKECGIAVPDYFIQEGRYYQGEETGRALAEMLKGEEKPTAVLFPDDYSLIGSSFVFEQEEIRVPEEISVAGYDGIPLSQSYRPHLTTVRQNPAEVGRQAALRLMEIMKEGKDDGEKILVPQELITGETVMPVHH